MTTENRDCDIFSPPYPRQSCTTSQLRENLIELHNWVSEQQDWANMKAAELAAPVTPWLVVIPAIPVTARFEQTAIADLFHTWQAVRQLREKFDDIVRNYETEDEWQSAPAIFFRLQLLRAAVEIISLASLSFEHREAKTQAEWERRQTAVLREIGRVLNLNRDGSEGERNADNA